MNPWLLILAGAGLTYLLRLLPLLLLRTASVHPDQPLARFFDSAASAVMGGVIYSALFGTSCYLDPSAHLSDPAALARLATIAVTVVVAVLTRGVFLTLMVCLCVYAALTFLVGA